MHKFGICAALPNYKRKQNSEQNFCKGSITHSWQEYKYADEINFVKCLRILFKWLKRCEKVAFLVFFSQVGR
jgi:hypothetical protein